MAHAADAMPYAVIPEAATRNVATAASRPLRCDIEPSRESASVPIRARPATVAMTPAGATATSAARAADAAASTRYVHAADCEAIQRRLLSGPASGPAARAALIAARLVECAPAGAPTIVATPAVTIESRHGRSYPRDFMIATPG